MKLTGKGGAMERDVYDKNSALYTDEGYKKLNMTQEQYLLATERIRQENTEVFRTLCFQKLLTY